MTLNRNGLLILAGLIAMSQVSHRASAEIVCSNGFQLVQGAWLATPYCQDLLVAKVAREYGVKAVAAEVRNNPNYKREICRFVGQDIRIKETCDTVNPHGRGRF